MLGQFEAIRPFVLRFLRERERPQQTMRGLQLICYAGLTAYGLAELGWSSALVLLSFLFGLATTLAAEAMALMRLHRAGCSDLVQANSRLHFVFHVVDACTKSPTPMIERRFTLDRSGSYAQSAGRANGVAGLSAAFLLLGGLLLVPAFWRLSGELGTASISAILVLAASNLVHGIGIFRRRLGPVVAGARWNIEFSPVARGFGLLFIGMYMLPPP